MTGEAVALVAAGAAGLALVLLLVRLARGRGGLGARVDGLAQGQERLVGALTQMTEAQIAAQSRLVDTVEARLDRVQERMGAATGHTADRLGALTERLAAIDAAQARIERLSGEVLSLKDILSNKQTRGAWGEVQLSEILASALPPDAYELQATLSNGRRADALLRFPGPPGVLAVDAKFPFEGFEALRAAEGEAEARRAETAFRNAVAAHVKAIASRYVLPGETADQALMFVPSEAVFAELHTRLGDVVRRGMEARVWIVSPATLMAVLTAMRGVMRDARLVAEAGRVRREIGLLEGDLGRLAERATALERHFAQAQGDLEAIRVSAEKAGRRAGRIEGLDFGAEPAQTPCATREPPRPGRHSE